MRKTLVICFNKIEIPFFYKKNYIICDFLVSFYLLNKILKKKKMDYKSLFDVKDKVLWWAMFSIKKKNIDIIE